MSTPWICRILPNLTELRRGEGWGWGGWFVPSGPMSLTSYFLPDVILELQAAPEQTLSCLLKTRVPNRPHPALP